MRNKKVLPENLSIKYIVPRIVLFLPPPLLDLTPKNWTPFHAALT